MNSIQKVGFGGSCHWCTEAIFQSLKGVAKVEQGWIGSDGPNSSFSEAVIVHFDRNIISLNALIAIHLHTHSCTSKHSMRAKYRSAIYTFFNEQMHSAKEALLELKTEFDDEIITEVLPFKGFKLNNDAYLNYYYSNPEKPFCENVVSDKLRLLLKRFANHVDGSKLASVSSAD